MGFVVITVPSSTVASDLTAFPLMIRLSDMPAEFWAGVKEDGGDIRVKTPGGASVAFDLSRFDYDAEDGVLWIRAGTVAAAADSVWHIHFDDAGLDLLPIDDTYGQQATWADYEAVFLFGETPLNRTGKGDRMGVGGKPNFFENESTSPGLLSHQGICFDGTHFISSDTNALRRWTSAWSLVTANTDPLGDTGIAGLNHCGDCEYHDGKIYVPVEEYPNSPYDNQHIAVFDSTTLAFITSFDISAQAHEVSGIGYCPLDGLMYVTDFTNSLVLYKYDPTDGSYQGTLSLNWPNSIPEARQLQGVTFWRGAFWVTSELADRAHYIDTSGNVYELGLFGVSTTAFEGICHTNDRLVYLDDQGTGNGVARVMKPYDLPLSAGGGAINTINIDKFVASGRNSSRDFTLGITFKDSNNNAVTKGIISYAEFGSAAANIRATMGIRSTGNFGVWDHVNSWLESAVNPTVDQYYRGHATYKETGGRERRLYLDGTQVASHTSGVNQIDGDLNNLFIAQSDGDVAENFPGTAGGGFGFAYLRLSVLSADWIAAEYAMLNSPGTFYDVELGVSSDINPRYFLNNIARMH